MSMATMKLASLVFVLYIGITTALPAEPIIRKLDSLRHQYVTDSIGESHLADLWMTTKDLSEAARYNPATDNVYHLFTRSNPSVSQPLLFGNNGILAQSFYSSSRRTIVLLHGWRDTPTSDFVTVLVPTFLTAEDVNVIVVDWTRGAGTINYGVALANTITSGSGVAQFIDWLNLSTGSRPDQYHIVGHGLGGHKAGIVGRRVQGVIAYITGLDPTLAGWINHSDRFLPNDGAYTEVIHTNAGLLGFLSDLAQVDFYPNGGESMPGCDSHYCDSSRSFRFLAESLLSGGFTGRRCINFWAAVLQVCAQSESLNMGGLRPKTGSTGVYLLFTNASPPYSQG